MFEDFLRARHYDVIKPVGQSLLQGWGSCAPDLSTVIFHCSSKEFGTSTIMRASFESSPYGISLNQVPLIIRRFCR